MINIGGILGRLFGKKKSRPKAVAFVDFEHWYISLDKMYRGMRPDFKEWYAELSKKYDVREIYVFADFSNQSLRTEIPRIREITNYIIETQNASGRQKKDYTDFIMLDHIYQKVQSAWDIEAFIIFSGDGHFSSVASFLKNQCGKTVGVYGIRDALSGQLKNTASWYIELPCEDTGFRENSQMILKNLKYLDANNRGKKKMYPTFWGTVDAVASYYNTDKEQVSVALRQLIEKEYIYQTEELITPRKSIKVLNVNWNRAIKDGLYSEQ